MEILVCPTCKGTGRKEEHDYHDSYYVDCDTCNKTGRIVQNEMHFKFTIPYSADTRILYDCNSKMFEHFREYEKHIKETLKKQ